MSKVSISDSKCPTARALAQLVQPLCPSHLEVHNFSHQHARGSDTHYRIILVSEEFAGKAKVARHRQVYRLVASLMSNPIHALVLDTYTCQEWQMKTRPPADLPSCRGGGD